jgi:tripartite ATP-independent transporter DctP family solute receptor
MALITTRRTLLAGAAATFAGHAAAQQVTTLKLYTQGFDIDATALAFEVPKRTEGRYNIGQIVGFDMLEMALGKERAAGGEQALIEGTRSGELDLIVISSAWLGNYIPEAQAFDVPFLFRDHAHAAAVLDGPIGQDVLAKFPAQGLVGLAWTVNGFRHLTNDRRPVRTPKDVMGLKLRTQDNPIIVKTFQTLGAEVTPMPWGQALFDALARGDLDGQENPIDAIVGWELHRWQKYLSLTGHIYGPAVAIMSRPAYDKLSDADKKAFVESARLAAQISRNDVERADDAGVAQLLGPMKINADVDKAAFRAALAPAYAEWRQQFGDLIDRIESHE